VKPLSLRTTLTATYMGMLALLVTVLAIGFRVSLMRQLDDDATQALEEKARGLHGYLRFKDGVPVLVYDHADIEESTFVADATRYYQIYSAKDGRLVVQSPALEALGLHYTPGEVDEFRASTGVHDVQTDRGRLRLLSTIIAPSPDEQYIVQTGELLSRIDATLANFDRVLFWRTLVGLVISGIVGWLLARWALAPFSRLAASAQAIDITSLHQRLAVRGTNDELDIVANAFNRALERVDASVGEMRQFSAALAHELRTPLAILRGETELALRRASSADELRQQLANQIEEFDRLTRLINQILTLARAEAGEIALVEELVDLAALGASVVEQIEPVAGARSIGLKWHATESARVKGDAGWLERLLLILLDNAINYTPDGGSVSASIGKTGPLVVLSVKDTGIGIPSDALPHVFERFFQADSGRSRHTEGAGLGLTLAKWIATRHGGSISVISQQGQGSTFTVTLPAI
jgi:two-component system OmpR family sensor kinase